MSMDSKPRGVSLSTTQATPLPAEVYPKVSFSSSSGSSLPIRAPLTVDSDFEFPISTNGQKNSTSSYSSDSGFESEGFVSGEDEFETASERPFVADPDDETLEETDYVVARTFVTDPDEEITEESGGVEGYVVSRPFVANPDEETLSTPMEEEDECAALVEPAVVDIGILSPPKPAMPIAQLSGDSDDDAVGSEEDDGYSGAVRVPGIGVLERINSAPKVKVFEVEEGEDESEFKPALEAELVEDSVLRKVVSGGLDSSEGGIVVKHSVKEDSISAELVEDKGPDDTEAAKVESLVATKDDIPLENSKLDEDVKHSVEEIQALENIKQQETNLNGRSVGERNVASGMDATTQRDMVTNSEVDKEVMEGNAIIATGIDKVSSVIEYPGESKPLETDKDVGSTNEADFIVDETKDKILTVLEANVVGDVYDERLSKIRGVEVFERIGVLDMGSDLTNYVTEETADSKLLGVDAAVTQVVEQSFPETVEPNLQEMELDVTEENNVNFAPEVPMDNQGHENNSVDVSGSVILGRGSDNKISQSKTEQRTDLGVESHDSVAASRTESDDSATGGSEIQNMDYTKFLEPYPTQETKYFGNGHSPGTTEGYVMEDGLHNKFNTLEPASLGSSLDPEVKVEMEDEADHDPDKLEEKEEVSLSDDDAEGFIFGVSDTAKQTMNELEQRLASTSLSGGGSSHEHLDRIDGQIIADTDEEVDTDGESEVKEIFDSAALAALLKAATGAGSDGGSVTFTSADGSRVFSLERPAGISSSFHSLRPAPQPNHPNLFTPSELIARGGSEEDLSEEEKRKLEKIQLIRVKFLRLVRRLDRSPEDSIAAQVLYRLVLAAGRPSSQAFSLESAKRTAMELEAEGNNDLNFSVNILVIGKTGVGKSATINSIFAEEKAMIDAFEPGTTAVKEIVGTIDGVKVKVLDTPGLRSSLMEQSFNRKILSSIKKFIKKCPPDIVLYVDRVDTQTRDLNDLPLLRSITSSLSSSIWRNAIVTLTHAASTPPDGPSGSPLSYEVFVAQRSRVVQQLISQAIGDLRMMNPSLMNPVSLVENHPLCRNNGDGQKVLPNGESWRPQLLLLCYSMKILSEVNSVAKAQDSFDHQKLFGFRVRSLPLPYLLSSLLQSNAHPKLSADQGGENVDSDIELGDLSDSDQEDEDEYDQLPPFKPLRRSQIAKLSKEQRKAYFEEYDYRAKLLQKKQWREEVKGIREMKKKGKDVGNNYGYVGEDEDQENGSPATVAVPVPDMALPPSFDGDNPAYRYRFLEPTSQLLTRPVLDMHGWDHDCGYDGVSLEESLAIAGRFPAVIAVQITKDKKEFNIHLDSSVAAKHGENGSSMAGFNIQTIGKQLAYILKGETKIKNFKMNKTAAGVSVTFLGENVATGLKIEDQIAVGKRLVLLGSTGAIWSQGDVAYGANLEVRLREKDFPIGQDQTTLGLSLMKWKGDLIWGGNLQSQFSIGRSSKMAVRAGLNNKLSGQISVKTSSSEQLQIALMGILPIANAIFRNIFAWFNEKYSKY